MTVTVPKVLLIGLGAMGQPMAARLAGFSDLWVFDIQPGVVDAFVSGTSAHPVAALTSLPLDLDAIILMLPHSGIVEAILLDDGLLERVAPGTLLIDMGSSLPASTRKIAAAAAQRGVAYLDAPVSGGRVRAISGELSIMLGGDSRDCERATSLLRHLGTTIVRAGGPGAGHAAKALNNLLSATHIAAAAEVVCAAQRFGIAPDTMVGILNNSTGRSQATEVKFPQHILPGSYQSGFRMDLMLKDIDTAIAIFHDVEAVGFITAAAAEITHRAARDLGATDHTEVARWYETVTST